MYKMNIPEILAPAGNMDALRAAVYAGCDAVYLGGEHFGARAYAGNFTQAELLEGIRFAHLYGVKVYLTVNTLFRNEEIDRLYSYILPLYEAGLDAVIVQDFGVLEYIHMHFPELSIHASTQMTITTKYAYDILKDYGVTRIVPARELSIDEITELKTGAAVPEVEIFVQGALCVCYSGQCFMSSFLGGRSGNRGRCAGSCRLPYSLYDKSGNMVHTEGDYLLSLKDLCGLEAVPELIKAGVDSFKIEGRMKKPEYVAACVRSYRRCVDHLIEISSSHDILYNIPDSYYDIVDECREDMASVFNRGGFTKGYYTVNNGKDMMSFNAPGNVGIEIGTITEINKNEITVKLIRNVHKGDIFIINRALQDITLTCNKDALRDQEIILRVPKSKDLSCGMIICRVYDSVQNDELRTYVEADRDILINGKAEFHKGIPARLSLSVNIRGEEYTVVTEGLEVETAKASPVNVETIRDKLSMLGNTRYSFNSLIIDADDDIFYPLKALKELRRAGIAELESAIAKRYMRKSYIDEINVKQICDTFNYNIADEYDFSDSRGLEIIVSNEEQLNYCDHLSDKVRVYIDLQFFDKRDIISFMSDKPDYGYALPPVLRRDMIKELKELFIDSCCSVIVRNIDELAYLKYIGYKGEIVADYTLYAMNDLAAHFICSLHDNVRITFPVELNSEQIKGLHYGDKPGILNVYGYQPLMTMVQCFKRNTAGCDHQTEVFWLRDRKNQRFPVRNVCKYCQNILYNSIPTFISDKISNQYTVRLHFTIESARDMAGIIDSYLNDKASIDNRTLGHYRRGVE